MGSQKLPSKMQNFYPDLDMVGKHYLIQQQDSEGSLIGNARQYTVATTMQPDIYSLLTSSLKDPANFQKDSLIDRIN